jgi:DNA polymerase elongation subunit (family B)
MSNFTLTDIDPYSCSLEDLDKEIAKLKSLKEEYFNREQAIKIFINSAYGAVGSPWFECYNVALAEAVTLQGQNMIKFANNFLDDYFLNIWHLDKKLHEALGLTYVNKLQVKTIVIYNDTDSVAKDTIIKTSSGDKTIELFYNENIKNGSAGNTLSGHESVITSDKVLNWNEEKQSYYAPVKRIIRHKVSKNKWKLKTKSGKEIIVTNDHSMIVFREGKKIEVKPSEIKKSDKILCIK